jgi:predicted transcriptional regulator
MKVITDILIEAINGSNKTRIMQRANLNYHRFDRYFSELLSCGVIRKGTLNGRVVYKTTEKGIRLISTLNRAEEILRS